MSASDKKQLRKAAMAEEMTQKQRREQAEAAAAKRKKTIYAVIGVACAIAAVILLMWNHKDVLDHNAVAAIVDGVDYKVSDLQYYYNSAKNQTYSLYQQYSSMGINVGYNPSLPDGAQWTDSTQTQTYADYFREAGLDLLTRTAALCAAAKEEGYTLSEDGEETLDHQLKDIDLMCLQYGMNRASYFNQVYGNGVTEAVFLRNLRNDLLAEEYANYHQENISYDDAALQAYYDEHPDELDSYDYRSFFISGAAPDPVDAEGKPVTDAEGNTVTATDAEKEAAMKQAEGKANTAVAEIKAAADREKAFIEAAPKYVSESTQLAYSQNESYSLSKGVVGNLLTQNSSVIAEWLMEPERKSGDVTSVESAGNGYFVVLFLDRYLTTDPTVNIRHILIQPEIADDAATNSAGARVPTDAAMAAAKAEAPYWKGVATQAKQDNDQSEWLTQVTESIESVAADGLSKVGGVNTAVALPSESPAA